MWYFATDGCHLAQFHQRGRRTVGSDWHSGTMAVLVHLEWDPNWVGAIGQWAGALGAVAAVVVALCLPRWKRKRDAAERLKRQRERQHENARLITITVPKNEIRNFIAIFNGSDLPVYQPRIDSISDPRVHCDPNPQPSSIDRRWQPSFHPEVLPSKATHQVLYDYQNLDGSPSTGKVDAHDVTSHSWTCPARSGPEVATHRRR